MNGIYLVAKLRNDVIFDLLKNRRLLTFLLVAFYFIDV